MNELLEAILENQANNELSFMTIDGIKTIDINNFVTQHIEGQLYDINRDRATLYSIANENKNKRWINDLALVYMYEYANEVIEKQRNEIDNLKSELETIKKDLENAQKSNVVEPTITTNEEKQKSGINPILTTCVCDMNNYDNLTVRNNSTSKTSRLGIEHDNNIFFQL